MEIISATQDYYPFSYQKDDTVLGPGAEIIRTVCERINADCTLTLQPWRRSMAMIRKGQVQSVFMVGKNKEREDWLIFSPPIMKTEYGFFECSESPINYNDPRSLNGKTIGVFGPSNTSHQLKKIVQQTDGNVNVNMTPDALTQFKKLARCRIDAVYSNREVGLAIIHEIKAQNIHYVGTNKKLNYYIAFSKEFTPPAFIKKFNEEIVKMKKR